MGKDARKKAQRAQDGKMVQLKNENDIKDAEIVRLKAALAESNAEIHRLKVSVDSLSGLMRNETVEKEQLQAKVTHLEATLNQTDSVYAPSSTEEVTSG